MGTQIAGGYILGIVTNNGFNIQKILQISWTGARWSVTPEFDLTGAGYFYNQKSFAANGCTNASATSCAGEQADFSLVGDYHFTKRFDTYAGAMWSNVSHGLANGYLNTTMVDPTIGARFSF